MVQVTHDNLTELEQRVAQVSARDEPLPVGLELTQWSRFLAEKIRQHRERWQGMTEAERCEVVETEEAIERFYADEALADEHEMRVKKRATCLKQSGCRLTDDAWDMVIRGRARMTDAMAAVELWRAESSRPWLVLSGLTGSGKSFAAGEWLSRHAGLWVRADELVRLWWANFGDQYERQNALRDARLLVIDDLGCEIDTQRMLAVLLDLLDSRKSARKHPVIVTTNLTMHMFAARYDNERLMSRMRESVEWVNLTTPDMRGPQ